MEFKNGVSAPQAEYDYLSGLPGAWEYQEVIAHLQTFQL